MSYDLTYWLIHFASDRFRLLRIVSVLLRIVSVHGFAMRLLLVHAIIGISFAQAAVVDDQCTNHSNAIAHFINGTPAAGSFLGEFARPGLLNYTVSSVPLYERTFLDSVFLATYERSAVTNERFWSEFSGNGICDLFPPSTRMLHPACDPGPAGGKGLQHQDFSDPIRGGGRGFLVWICKLESGIPQNHLWILRSPVFSKDIVVFNTGHRNRCCNPLPSGPQIRTHWVEHLRQLGLRLFWHQRGRNMFLLAFAIMSCSILKSVLSIDVFNVFGTLFRLFLFLLDALHALLSSMTAYALCVHWTSNTAQSAVSCFCDRAAAHYFRAGVILLGYFTMAVCCGMLFGILVPQFVSSVFLWAQLGFDATLGYPGEGPCTLCGDSGHNFRTCPFRGDVPQADVTTISFSGGVSARERNTFVDTYDVPVAAERARSLRGHSSHGDIDSPPSQLRRIDELGQAVPGSQDTERGSQDSALADQASRLDISADQTSTNQNVCPACLSDWNFCLCQRNRRATASTGSSSSAIVNASQNSSEPPLSRPARIFCPVPGCPEHDTARANGWADVSSMRDHLNDHCSGRFLGAIPSAFLEQHRLSQCQVCSRLLSTRFGNACPRCRPELRRRASSNASDPPSRPAAPSFEDVAKKRSFTKKAVPKGAKRLWSQCLLSALCAVVAYNDTQSWQELYALPKCTLRGQQRGGASRHRGEAETKRLCQGWLEGQRMTLWQQVKEAKSKQQRVEADDVSDTMRNRVRELAGLNQFAKACKAVVQAPPVQVSEHVLAEMESKHPVARAALRWEHLRPVHPAASVVVTIEDVRRAIKSFPKGSGCGPSGLRPQHLRDALVPGFEDEVLRQLTAVINILLRGEAPDGARSFLSGASLTALPKDDGDLRPIAVGEVLRRLAGKCCANSVKDDMRDILEPWQVGVGTPGGCEAVVHAVRHWFLSFAQSTDRVLARVDLSNAFNSVDRQEVLASTRELAPSLVPWVDWTYGAASHLIMDGQYLASQRGVQQGDPLGPLLFSLAIHRAFARIRLRAPTDCPGTLDISVFYLDDGVLAGESRAVAWACRELKAELENMGLSFNMSKSCITPSSASEMVDRELFPGWQWNDTRNVKILGAAVGDETFCEELLAKRFNKAANLLQKLGDLGDVQCGYLLLRSCSSYAKLMYSIRTTPAMSQGAGLRDFDSAVLSTFSSLTQLYPDEHAWSRARWCTAAGGLGLRSVEDHADAAFAASITSTIELQTAIFPGMAANDILTAAPYQAALASLQPKLAAPLFAKLSSGEGVTQKLLSKSLDTTALESCLADATTPLHMKSHLQLVTLPGADPWLHAPPSQELGTQMSSELYRIALGRRLRLPFLDTPASCGMCGAALDVYMDHALVCGCGGDRTLRHNAIRNVTYRACQDAGINAELEKAGLLPPRPNGEEVTSAFRSNVRARRPADIWIPNGFDGQGGAVDFAVTSGLRADRLAAAASDPASIGASYEYYKRTYLDTQVQCSHQGFRFLPFVVEAHGGGLAICARRILSFIAKAGAARNGEEIEVEAAGLSRRISISLQRENARAVLRRLWPDGGITPAPDPGAWAASQWQ